MDMLVDLLNIIVPIVTISWLFVTIYYRFVKKKPIRFEHGLIKVFLMNKEVGRTRLYSNGDTITIGFTILPWAINYPTYSRGLTILFIAIVFTLYMHSLVILMHNHKHRASKWVARAASATTLCLSAWTVLEFVSLI